MWRKLCAQRQHDNAKIIDETTVVKQERAQEKLYKPAMYKVILNNDDYTPIDFVVIVLKNFFAYDLEKAIKLTLKVHHEGKAVCGLFTAEIAETKVYQINQYSREHEHPLRCTLEKAE